MHVDASVVVGIVDAGTAVVLVPWRLAVLRDERQTRRQRRAGVPGGRSPRSVGRADPRLVVHGEEDRPGEQGQPVAGLERHHCVTVARQTATSMLLTPLHSFHSAAAQS